MSKPARWTDDQEKTAKDMRATTHVRDIALAVGKTPKAVERYFHRIGLTKEKAIADFANAKTQTKTRKTPNKTNLKTSWGDKYIVKSVSLDFKKTKTILPVIILPDIHAGMEDMRAIDLACKVIKEVKPVLVIYLGDNVDWPQLSKFNTAPDMITKAQAEIDLFHEIDKSISAAAGSHVRRYWIMGNHEERLYRYLCKHPEIAMLRGTQIEAILGLDDNFKPLHNLQLVEKEINWRDRFIIKHGNKVRTHSGWSARAELEAERISGISGHTHRAGPFYVTNRGKTQTWIEGGCLCTIDPTYTNNPNWQHAVNVGYFNGDRSNDYFHVDQIVFGNYQAMVNGKFISA